MQKSVRCIRRHIGVYEIVAFVTGFTLMAFELVASRILAPTIGTSTYVWTSVIGVMIAALALGYAAGGWAADKRAEQTDIAWLLLLTALFILLTRVTYQGTLEDIAATLHDSRAQGVVASIFLFVPASFLMGVISPYLARLRVRSLTTTGRSVAGLSASNSVGGIVGTFCTGFIFFSIIGSRETLALLIFLLVACSWLLAPNTYRKPRLIATLALLGILALQIVLPARAGAVAEIDTPTSHYKIIDTNLNGRPIRLLTMGPGGWQTGVYASGPKNLAFIYTRKLADVVAAAPSKNKILILGGGAFSLPEYLGRTYPNSNIDVVEIDPKLPEIAEQYFRYTPTPNIHTYTEDARTYLKNTSQRYDIIITDVYNDSSVPFSLSTKEYTGALHDALKQKGIVAANLIGSASASCMPLLASVHASYSHAFSNYAYYPLGEASFKEVQNIIAVYSEQSLDWATALPGRIPIKMNSGYSLTDNYAPTEYLKQKCGG